MDVVEGNEKESEKWYKIGQKIKIKLRNGHLNY